MLTPFRKNQLRTAATNGGIEAIIVAATGVKCCPKIVGCVGWEETLIYHHAWPRSS